MKKLLAVALGALMLFSVTACDLGGGSGSGHDPSDATISGTLEQTDVTTGFVRTTAEDDFGRAFVQTEAYGENVVGIFYFLWLSQAAYDVTINDWIEDGKAEYTLSGDIDPDTGKSVPSAPTFSWWGEPMYGYYQVEDEWVVRKHVELFINAGLDFICFDTTNNDFYRGAATAVLNVLLEYQQLGYDVPKAMFMTNTRSNVLIDSIYKAFYRTDKYDPIWFTGNGDKPWILGSANSNDATIRDRFYFKKTQWPNAGISEDGFPWMDWHWPQDTYVDVDNGYNIMSVSVTQHVGISGQGTNFSLSGLCSPAALGGLSQQMKDLIAGTGSGGFEATAARYYNANWGRGYSHSAGNGGANDPAKINENINFEEQWATAKNNGSINLVFVTGWNEWIAQRQSKDPRLGGGYGYYVDTYNTEFSRDVEMMNGGYLDNCYLQLVRNIREFNGVGSTCIETAASTGDLYDLTAWSAAPAYADLVKETLPRDHAGAGENRYVNNTGRNDIREVRVATTDDDVWFLITTVDDITVRDESDTRWMNLWVGVEGSEEGWNSYQYVINRSVTGTSASVDRIANNAYTSAGTAACSVSGKYMIVKVAKSTLGITDGAFGIRFKVTDNLQKDFDITDLYTNGDCAPIGRISYSYYAK